MPIFKSGEGRAPFWCEMESFEIINLAPGTVCVLARKSKKEKLFLGQGTCTVSIDDDARTLNKGEVRDVPERSRRIKVSEVITPSVLIRVCGRWGNETGSCGVFTLTSSSEPRNDGDPADYPRNTQFDNHYHDFDEYWIIFGGKGEVVTEEKRYTVSAGDCVATGKGHHHDFPWVDETIRGVWFETTLQGKRRLGHLWEHTHGPAEPKISRI